MQNEYRRNHTPDAAYERAHFLPEDTDERLSQIPEDEAPTAAYQVGIIEKIRIKIKKYI